MPDVHVHVQTLVAKETHRLLRIEALDTGISLQMLLRTIIHHYLNKEEEENVRNSNRRKRKPQEIVQDSY